MNLSIEPSMNLTRQGVLAVAYVKLTNMSPCQSHWQNFTQTEIGVMASTDLGMSFSNPTYLGGWNSTNCAAPEAQLSAWEPSLGSLSNGTLVLVYVAFNDSGCYPPPYFCFTGTPPESALMFTESYNNGTTWTVPRVLNLSTPTAPTNPSRPWIGATGNTIYIAWANATNPAAYYGGMSQQLNLLVSTDGGRNWTQRTPPAVFPGGSPFGSGVNYDAENPFLLLAPNGTLWIAYMTNTSYRLNPWCQGVHCLSGINTADIVLASSSTNGSSYRYSIVAKDLVADFTWFPMFDPSPQLAFDPKDGQLFVAYSSGQIGFYCFPYGCFDAGSKQVYVQNSSDGGRSWSVPHGVANYLNSPDRGPGSELFNPSVAVDRSGELQVELEYTNTSMCKLYGGTNYFCGAQNQLYLNSSDNGSSFSLPIELFANQTVNPQAFGLGQWSGEYDSLIDDGSHLLIAWTSSECPVPVYLFPYCVYPPFYGASLGTGEVHISHLYNGTGAITVYFNETGLPSRLNWSASLMGNLRSGGAGTSLSVSGVPPNTWLNWSVPWVNQSWGLAWAANYTPPPPGPFSATANQVRTTFSEFAWVDVSSNPPYPSDSFSSGYLNYNINPLGGSWSPVGKAVAAAVTPAPCNYIGCSWQNLSFLGWTGVGNGSVNSNLSSISMIPYGPINESANFQVNGWCAQITGGAPYCVAYNYNMTFVETGLPAGVVWNVTLDNQTESSSNATMIFDSAQAGLNEFTVWTIPASAGRYWVGTPSVASPVWFPVQTPDAHRVVIKFSLVDPSTVDMPVQIGAEGLPNQTAWTLDIDRLAYGVRTNVTSLDLPGGVYSINGSFVYNTSGVGYRATSVNTTPFVLNSTGTSSLTLPANVTIQGPTSVEVQYGKIFYLSVAASAGGTVAQPSRWVDAGGSVTLTAVPAPGFYFVGWTGIGPGSLNASTPSVTVRTFGPVSEFASFAPSPSPVFNITVGNIGLPSGSNYSITVGGTSYAGSGQFRVAGLAPGNYSLSASLVLGDNGTRYVPLSLSSSFASVGGLIHVAEDGFVNVTFGTQFLLSVISDTNGQTVPAPGGYWEDAGASVSLSATPNFHYQFGSWNGSGAGAYTGGRASVTIHLVSGPVLETAQFLWMVLPPPREYNLTVREQGLPSGTSWSVSGGGFGSSGVGPSLVVQGLNGSYTFSASIVYTADGTRFIPEFSTYTVTVTQSNASLNVRYGPQFLLTVLATPGGSVSPAGSGWYAGNVSVELVAVANVSYTFVGWSGTGVSSSQPNLTVVLDRPNIIWASFSKVAPVQPATSPFSGLSLALAVMGVLGAAGLAFGWVVFGRRTPPPAATAGMKAADENLKEPGEPLASGTPPEGE
ncbi:MAG TPA: hypothetical protein VJS68_02525 [Thermoplasmata archaeon]|nr:hypothetical protein [Thermoplasmata archaeon]